VTASDGSGPRPGGPTLRLGGSWGTEVRGWPLAVSVLTRLAACELVSRSLPKRSEKRTLCDDALPTEGTALDATGHR
jgi:hypothetical protein